MYLPKWVLLINTFGTVRCLEITSSASCSAGPFSVNTHRLSPSHQTNPYISIHSCLVLSFCYCEYSCIRNVCMVRRHHPAPEEQAWQSGENSFHNYQQCTHTSSSCIQYNDRAKRNLAILPQTKLTLLIICSNYYHQIQVIEASVWKQIALEIVFTPVP